MTPKEQPEPRRPTCSVPWPGSGHDYAGGCSLRGAWLLAYFSGAASPLLSYGVAPATLRDLREKESAPWKKTSSAWAPSADDLKLKEHICRRLQQRARRRSAARLVMFLLAVLCFLVATGKTLRGSTNAAPFPRVQIELCPGGWDGIGVRPAFVPATLEALDNYPRALAAIQAGERALADQRALVTNMEAALALASSNAASLRESLRQQQALTRATAVRARGKAWAQGALVAGLGALGLAIGWGAGQQPGIAAAGFGAGLALGAGSALLIEWRF